MIAARGISPTVSKLQHYWTLGNQMTLRLVPPRWRYASFCTESVSSLRLVWRTHVRQQVEESVAAERAHGQRHQEGEQEFEAGLVEDGYEHHAQQREQADDSDGHKAPQPNPRWRDRQTEIDSITYIFTYQQRGPGRQCIKHFGDVP